MGEAGENPPIKTHRETNNTQTDSNATSDQRRRLAGALRAIGQKALGFGKELLPLDEKVRLEDITTPKVADIIFNNVRNPLTRDPWKNPFDITTVMTNMGYIGAFNTTNYRTKFAQEYLAVQRALRELADKGVIEGRVMQTTNAHNESMFYKVTDPEALQQTAIEDKSPKPKS